MDSPTKTFKGCIFQLDVFGCCISPVLSDRNFESSVQLVGFVFRSLTEASHVQANLTEHSDSASSAAGATTYDENDVP